jgi:hypothetical protein
VDPATLVSLVAALGVGTWIAKLLEQSSQSRRSRADALEALGNTEVLRWAPSEEGWPGLRTALHRLEAAALIARVPSELVRKYAYLARVGWSLSIDDWDRDHDPETGGGIPADMAEAIDRAAVELRDAIWKPIRARMYLGRKIRTVDLEVSKVTTQRALSALESTRP